jgi:hypothetical protein
MDAHTSWFDGHDSALPQLLLITAQRRDGGRALLFRAQRYETNDPAVRLAAHDRNLSEVLVERNHNLMISVPVREDLGIAGIARPVPNALDLVSSGDQRVAGTAPDAAVEENLHGSAVGQRWFNPFVADHTSCIDEARANVIWVKPRVAL